MALSQAGEFPLRPFYHPPSDATELPTTLRADARAMHRRHRLQPQ